MSARDLLVIAQRHQQRGNFPRKSARTKLAATNNRGLVMCPPIRPSSLTEIGEATDRADVNRGFFQPFANYNLGNGRAVGASIEATANWDDEEVWNSALIFTVSKSDRARQATGEFCVWCRSQFGEHVRHRFETSVPGKFSIPTLTLGRTVVVLEEQRDECNGFA
jgi:hypothetical protein